MDVRLRNRGRQIAGDDESRRHVRLKASATVESRWFYHGPAIAPPIGDARQMLFRAVLGGSALFGGGGGLGTGGHQIGLHLLLLGGCDAAASLLIGQIVDRQEGTRFGRTPGRIGGQTDDRQIGDHAAAAGQRTAACEQ